MFLTRLLLNAAAPTVRRDARDVQDMHRTVMSAYPKQDDTITYRENHGVLWRVDRVDNTYVQYIQSATEPDWSGLPAGHLAGPPLVRTLQPVLDAIAPGRRLSFRLLANPTRCIRTDADPHTPKRVPHRDPAKQVEWLVRKGDDHGFVLPATRRGEPDVTTTPVPNLTGRKKTGKITIEPVRYDGHLVVTDAEAFAKALVTGIGRGKSYGCGLISLAPARAA